MSGEWKPLDTNRVQFVNVAVNTEGIFKVLDTNIIKPDNINYSPYLSVEAQDGQAKNLSLPKVLHSKLSDGIKTGQIKAGTWIRVVNKGKVTGKPYFDYDIFVK